MFYICDVNQFYVILISHLNKIYNTIIDAETFNTIGTGRDDTTVIIIIFMF